MVKSTSTLLLLAVAVVATGVVYLLRPTPEPQLAQSETTTMPTPVDNTKPWPPNADQDTPPGVQPITTVVQATIKTTKGDIQVALDGTRAPLTVGNFVALAKQDFYDGTVFHRVIPDFMIQGGDPNSKDQSNRAKHGQGGPGYTFPDEINAVSYGLHQQRLADVMTPAQLAQLPPEAAEWSIKQLYEAQGYNYTETLNSLPLTRGVLAMANSGPNTNGSQFFIITTEATPYLHGKHTPFGTVTAGIEIVDAIAQVERDANDNPIDPIIITDVVIADILAPGLQLE